MDWNGLQLVLDISRSGTLAAAARRLSVDQTTVSRRLKVIESRIGAALFSRTDGHLLPSEAGERVIAAAEEMEAAAGRLRERLEGGLRRCEGTVRITAVPILTNRLLIPNLKRLLHRHPHLRIETVAGGGNLSLSRRETDLALRLARPQKDIGFCRRLGDIAYSLYEAAADNTNRPDDRSSESWIAYEDTLAHLPQARWIASQPDQPGRTRLRVNDAESAYQAARSGLGRTLLPDIVAGEDKALRRVDRGKAVLSREVWLIVHPEIRQLPRTGAVIEWLDELFSGLKANKGMI